jgi:hypothetical protein
LCCRHRAAAPPRGAARAVAAATVARAHSVRPNYVQQLQHTQTVIYVIGCELNASLQCGVCKKRARLQRPSRLSGGGTRRLRGGAGG